jgi:hypothetical protein
MDCDLNLAIGSRKNRTSGLKIIAVPNYLSLKSVPFLPTPPRLCSLITQGKTTSQLKISTLHRFLFLLFFFFLFAPNLPTGGNKDAPIPA